MNITKSTVQKLLIRKAGADTISVYLEDMAPGHGKLMITCFDSVWSNFWAAMGDKTIAQFFCNCDSQYLIGKLLPAERHKVFDPDGTIIEIKKTLLQIRLEGKFRHGNARGYWNKIAELKYENDVNAFADWFQHNHGELGDVLYGGDWYPAIQMKKSSEYLWLQDGIIPTIKAALKQEGLA